MTFGTPLTDADAAVFEEAVVPRYLSYFGGLCAEMLLPCPQAQIAHINCRTGYPDPVVAEKVPKSAIFGVDAAAPGGGHRHGRGERQEGGRPSLPATISGPARTVGHSSFIAPSECPVRRDCAIGGHGSHN